MSTYGKNYKIKIMLCPRYISVFNFFLEENHLLKPELFIQSGHFLTCMNMNGMSLHTLIRLSVVLARWCIAKSNKFNAMTHCAHCLSTKPTKGLMNKGGKFLKKLRCCVGGRV